MLSTANSRPPRKSKIPKTRYHHTNEALRSGAKLPSRCDPQISAARCGEAAAKAPSAMATAPTNRFISTGIRMIDAVSEPAFASSSWEYRGGSTIRPQEPEKEQRYPHSDWPAPERD